MEKNINIFWKDCDGDKISLETDEALQIALDISQKQDWIFKLVVTGRLLDLWASVVSISDAQNTKLKNWVKDC